MTTTRQRAQARLAARFGKLSRLAVLSSTATAAVIAVGVAAAPSDTSTAALSGKISLGSASGSVDLDQFAESREQRSTRSAPRIAPPVKLEPEPTDHKFATAKLNIWKGPQEKGPRSEGLIPWGTKVAVTGQREGHWAEVLLPRNNGNGPVVRWVNADYLADKKPKPEKVTTSSTTSSSTSSSSVTAPSVGGVCSNGSSVSSGVSPSVVEIHQSVCASWPEVTSYGTFRADSGDHGSGRAIDIMVSGDTGWAIAEFVRANASSFGVSYIIYAQKIWSIDRSGEGWRYMEDRGSTTANHYDHVHVSVY
jgi:hypothetical protein